MKTFKQFLEGDVVSFPGNNKPRKKAIKISRSAEVKDFPKMLRLKTLDGKEITARKDQLKPISLLAAFGGADVTAAEQAGFKFIEKPGYWDEINTKPYISTEGEIHRFERDYLGHKIPVYDGEQIYGKYGQPRGPLASVAFMPPEDLFIIRFPNKFWYLVTPQANTYIRMWSRILPFGYKMPEEND